MNRRPFRSCGATAALSVALLLSSCAGDAMGVRGAAGGGSAGDPLFPALGNGGYQVRHYGLDLAYDVKKKQLDATAEITAEATKDLRSFQLDLQGLRVSDVRVDGKDAAFSRKGHKLIVRPATGLRKGADFRTRVNYGGTPQELKDPDGSREGWVKTADGAFVSGEPAGSMTWFPGNNHPGDKATYDFTITVPKGYTAVANGELRSERTAKGRTTFEWHNGAADGQLSRHRRHRQVRCPHLPYARRAAAVCRGGPGGGQGEQEAAGAAAGDREVGERAVRPLSLLLRRRDRRQHTGPDRPGSRWRPRPSRSTPGRRTPRPWCTRWPISGSATR